MESTQLERLRRVAGRQTTRLTHYGRKTGKPHEVTIWFVLDGDTLYIGSANVNRQWVRNVQKTPLVLRPKEPPAPRQEEPLITQTAVLDLRDRSPQRGQEPGPGLPPLEMARNVSHLEIYLPLGSDEGLYDVRVTTTQGEPVLAATEKASIEKGLTSMRVDMAPSTIRQGRYILQIRKRNWEWTSFPLVVE